MVVSLKQGARFNFALIFSLFVAVFLTPAIADATIIEPEEAAKKIVIAHGVAGGPNNSMASFQNAVAAKPDYVEADLQLTKDGVLVCHHDPTLEAISNIETFFPERFKLAGKAGEVTKKWYFSDFTLAEIRQLEMEAPIVTLGELLDLVKGKSGLYLETKDPLVYRERGLDIDEALHKFLSKRGIKSRDGTHITPVIIQSFHEDSLKLFRAWGGRDYTLIQLVWFPTWSRYMTEDGLDHVASYADGIGPVLSMILPPSDGVVKAAHKRGLLVHGWHAYEAFPPSGFDGPAAYSDYLFNRIGLDGLFTEYPAAARGE